MALTCHIAMDLLCQEMRDSSESLGSPTANKSLSLTVDGPTVKERDVVRENKEKEEERATGLSFDRRS